MRILKWSLSGLLILIFAVCLILPDLFLPKIEAYVTTKCQRCTIDIADVDILPGTDLVIYLNNVKFSYTPNDKIEGQIHKIRIAIKWLPLLKDSYQIRNLAIGYTEVMYTDNDNNTVSTGAPPILPLIHIEKTEITNGIFQYLRSTKGTSALFVVRDIRAQLSPFSTSPNSKNEEVRLDAEGRVGYSGHTKLNVKTFLWREAAHIDAALSVKDQSLGDLTEFLKENAGVSLSGKMLNGDANLQLRGLDLKTYLKASYQDFDIKIDPMYDRNQFTAFFMNLGAAIAMKKKSKGNTDEFVELKREPNEPIVGFMLRGLKEAAIRLSMAQPF